MFLFNSFNPNKSNVVFDWGMKNRSRYEVIAAILKSAGREETRTKIMYKAMLSNEQCKSYLVSLISNGLMQEVYNGTKTVYKITSKGNTFLGYYDQMMELLPIFLEEGYEEYYKLATQVWQLKQ